MSSKLAPQALARVLACLDAFRNGPALYALITSFCFAGLLLAMAESSLARGDSAWGTRGNWCMLYGRKQQDTLSVVMIDHPSNPGYPTYWHARGYGLFAANPLGQKIFSNGKETYNFHLRQGESTTFRYRIVIAAGGRRLSTGRIGQLADDFAQVK